MDDDALLRLLENPDLANQRIGLQLIDAADISEFSYIWHVLRAPDWQVRMLHAKQEKVFRRTLEATLIAAECGQHQTHQGYTKSHKLPKHLWSLDFLRRLHLEFGLQEFHAPGQRNIERLVSLEELVLRNNRFEMFPKTLVELPKLRTLDLSRNRLRKGFDKLEAFPALERLDLSYNELEVFPKRLWLSPNLRTLDLSHNVIRKNCDAIEAFPALERLDLSYNELEVFPDRLGLSPNLRTINMRNNKIRQGLDTMEAFPALEELDLTYNELEAFLDRLWLSPNLRTINMNSNKICRGFDTMEAFPALEELDLSYNKLEVFPERLGLSPKLRWLSFAHNPIREGYEFLPTLQALEELDLTGARPYWTQIIQLPPKLRILHWLDIPETTAPMRFAPSTTLERVHLSGDLPDSLAQMPNLQWIYWHHKPIPRPRWLSPKQQLLFV